MAKSATRWLPIFKRFLNEVRITSKHASEDPDGDGIPLKMWTSQTRVLEDICDGLENDIHTFYILKSRQLGVTTVTLAILIFWLALHPNTIGCQVSESDKSSAKNRATVSAYLASLAKFMGKSFGVVKNNKYGITFSNKSRLDFLVAGKSKTNWGEGEGYLAAVLTEVAAYGREEGLDSFRHAMAPENPRSLYIFESTAKGPNHWKDMWDSAVQDEFSSKPIFVGWWSHDLQRIKVTDRRYVAFGIEDPTALENDKIIAVRNLYNFDITREQLAWHRWQSSLPNSNTMDMDQNQPFTAQDCFVLSGISFFQTRLLMKRREEITEGPNKDLHVSDGGFGYDAYNFYLGDDYHLSKVEAIINYIPSEQRKLRVWEKPVPEGWYVIGVDPAFGRSDVSDNHCLSEDSEILTRLGWKRHDQIEPGDIAVCFNGETGGYEYGEISRKIVKLYTGDMIRFRNDGLDCMVTPDHRVVYRHGSRTRDGERPKWKVKRAEWFTRKTSCNHMIPIGGAPIGGGISGLSLDMCRAIGWILTDGHVKTPVYAGTGERKGKKRIRKSISVGQAVGTTKAGINVADEMEEVFSDLCPDARINRLPPSSNAPNNQDRLIVRIGAKHAEQFIKWFDAEDNRIPRRILVEGSREQLESLFQGILEGDGNWYKPGQRWAKVCPGLDKDFADDIQELAGRLGYSATIGTQGPGSKGTQHQYLVYLSTRSHHTIRKEEDHRVPYDGLVWCVTVPTGAFVARRNGKMFVTGNCASVWRCFADKMVQVAEWADNVPDTRHCAWVMAYLAGQYQNCRLNIDLTGGPGAAVMQAFDDLRQRMRSEMYQGKIEGFEDFLGSANWYLYRRIDSPGPGFMYNTKVGRDLKFRMMNMLRDSWVTNLLELRSVPLIDEMANVRQQNSDIAAEIGPSGTGRSRDDRTFAMALAHLTWAENLRPGLIAQGITWEGTRARESGDTSPVAETLNRRIYGILRAADEMADLPPPKTFYEERGLL